MSNDPFEGFELSFEVEFTLEYHPKDEFQALAEIFGLVVPETPCNYSYSQLMSLEKMI